MPAFDRRRLLAALGAAGGLAAFQAPLKPPKPGDTVVINGKTVHLATGDPGWKLLNTAKVTTDRKRGVMLAAFPPPLAARNGQPLTIRGFIVPLVATPKFDRFLLTKTNYACGFCPPPAPTEAIEVKLRKQRIKAHLDEIKVQGRLVLVASSEESVFYRLEDAVVAS
jgi:hypothetical protein